MPRNVIPDNPIALRHLFTFAQAWDPVLFDVTKSLEGKYLNHATDLGLFPLQSFIDRFVFSLIVRKIEVVVFCTLAAIHRYRPNKPLEYVNFQYFENCLAEEYKFLADRVDGRFKLIDILKKMIRKEVQSQHRQYMKGKYETVCDLQQSQESDNECPIRFHTQTDEEAETDDDEYSTDSKQEQSIVA